MNPGDVIKAQLVFSNVPMTFPTDDYIPMRPDEALNYYGPSSYSGYGSASEKDGPQACDRPQSSRKPDDYIPPRPIPMLERKPRHYDPEYFGVQDCDDQGRCWYFRRNHKEWHLRRLTTLQYSMWLPWWALPLPEVGE